MLVRFRANLGTIDVANIKQRFGVELDHTECTIGAERNVPDLAANWMLSRRIVDPVETSVRGVAKQAAQTAPAKT